jgi:hypothetical protein
MEWGGLERGIERESEKRRELQIYSLLLSDLMEYYI